MKKVVIVLGITFIVLIIGFIIYYNTSYFIILNGEKEITINLNEEYKELGAKTIINSKIKIDGLVDNTKVGEYKIKYYHNKKYKERIVTVIDNIKPELVLNGISEVNVVMNGQYIEQGATATDNYDGDITDNIIITNNIDLTKPGEYKVSYQIKDSSNNTTTLDRIVNVSEKGPLSLSIKEFTLDGYFENAILKETEDMGQNYLDETIFYGDSITFNFFYYGQLKQSSIWAMSSLTPEKAHIWEVPFYKYHDEIKFVDGLKKYKPKRVIITLGANSVAVTTKDFFIDQYEELVKKAKEASPTTTIIVQSIFIMSFLK